MSKISLLYSMYLSAAIAATGESGPDKREKRVKPKEDEEQKKQRLVKSEIERNKANGLKEFFYGENSVWAINQKVADKKAKKQNLISSDKTRINPL